MLSEVLKNYLMSNRFVWDGNRCFSKNYERNVRSNQTVIINGQLMQQPSRTVHFTVTVEDYGSSSISDIDDSNYQEFNFVSFKQEAVNGKETSKNQQIVSFFDFEEEKLLQTVQRFLGEI